MLDHDAQFRALADPLRLRILAFLHKPEAACCTDAERVCACDLEGLVGLSQPAVSHHMKILVQAGLVAAEKSGRWVFYRLNRSAFAGLAQALAALGGGEPAPALAPAPASLSRSRKAA